ncbi:MAG: LpqB family beta-propeller domain-containing protein, partial [Actinomadura sp.]
CPSVVVVALALGLATACASVPTGSRVASGRPAERAESFDDPYVRIVPVRPGRDWLPSQIVEGFLSASASFDDLHAVAREYLVRNVGWDPDTRPTVTVYANSTLQVIPDRTGTDQATVRVTAEQLGIIRADGQYEADPKSVDEIFNLVKSAQGQWRIARLPVSLSSGLLLSRRDVDRAFRTMNLYFFAPDRTGLRAGSVLVPNAIFLPLVNRSDRPTQLVRALLNGPTAWLYPAVRNAFPSGTRLLGNAVEIADGVATVDLSAEAEQGDLARMSAQLMWTLRQLVEVKSMKLEIEGETRSPPDVGATQAPRDWQHNNPDAVTGTGTQPAYLVGADDRLAQLVDDSSNPLDTLENEHLYDPSISLDYRTIAGLSRDRNRILMGELTGTTTPARLHTVLTTGRPGVRFTSPTFDRDGTMWTVESDSTGSALWIKERGRPLVRVGAESWGLSDFRVRALRVARDGVRVAAIVEDMDRHAQLQIGRIVRQGRALTAGEFLPINSELADVTDLAWQNAGELAVLGRLQRTTAEVLPYRVLVSGGGIAGIGTGAQGEMTSISAAPNSPALVSARVPGKDSAADRLCRLTDPQDPFSEWDCFVGGSDPFYPG